MINFVKLSWKIKLLLIGTFCLLGMVRLAILILPFRYLTPLMGKKMAESPREIDYDQLAKAVKVSWSVNAVSSYTPWESKCLVRAFTVQLILLLLNIPSTLYLGLKKDNSKGLQAHAWLRCGEFSIMGFSESSHFKQIIQFATFVK